MELAKYLLAFVAVFNFGGLVADALVPASARQHLFNPAWPPHAKFHNSQTMLMGMFGGTASLTILFTQKQLTPIQIAIAAAFAGNYFFAMTVAQAFPSTAWIDPQFAGTVGRPFGLYPQQLVSYVLCCLTLVALVLAFG